MHRITPLQLDLLMNVYVSPTKIPLATSTHEDQWEQLVNSDMIVYNSTYWTVTERGEAYVDHILSTPFPEKKYVVVRDDTEANNE